jgi:dTDP-4-amino-4,6-dideoxygalactose transaminase
MILKSAENTQSFRRNLVFTSAARVAFRHLLSSLQIEQPQVLLLPAYIGFTDREGSGVFDPVEQTRTSFEFYKVDDNLAFSFNDIEQRFKAGDVKAFLIIHYFGFCSVDIDKLAALCKAYDVLLIEDCAHAFQLASASELFGNKGDFAFYSLHKYLPTSSGGILRINNSNFKVDDIQPQDAAADDVMQQFLTSNLAAIAERRIENYKRYAELLTSTPGLEIMYQLKEGLVPQSFPVRIKNQQRERLYFQLIDRSMPTTALYYRLIDAITKDSFPVSHQISSEILNFPVHQDTSLDDINSLVGAVKSCLGARTS